MSQHSLAQIGVDAEAEADDARADAQIQTGKFAEQDDMIDDGPRSEGGPKDYFIERNGLRYAGSHLILDLWDAEHLDDAEVIEIAFRRAIQETGATLLHMHFHVFSDNGGMPGGSAGNDEDFLHLTQRGFR